MSRKWIVAALFLVFASVAVAREAFVRDGAEDEIKKVEAAWAKAYTSRDPAFLEKMLNEDFTFTGPEGSFTTKKEEIGELRSGAVAFESFGISDLRVRVWGDCGVATGKAAIKGKVRGQDFNGEYRFTDTYVKKDGAWTCVAGQMTRVMGK